MYTDTDYAIDKMLWQHVDLLQDRFDALDLTALQFRRSVGVVPSKYRAISCRHAAEEAG